jgi:hypothetical protein
MKCCIVAILIICAVAGVSCHKGAGPVPVPAPSGSFTETSPVAGATTLNFLNGDSVIVTGSKFFLMPLSGPDTFRFSLTPGAKGTQISFVPVSGPASGSVTCQLVVAGSDKLSLDFTPCPPGVPCNALGGMDFVFER